jgi:hypothetical protein
MRAPTQIAVRYMAALTLLLMISAYSCSPTLAGDYPDRTVKIIVPFPAGGPADAVPPEISVPNRSTIRSRMVTPCFHHHRHRL